MVPIKDNDLSVIGWALEASDELIEVHPGVSVPARVTASGPCGNVPRLREASAPALHDVDVSLTAVFDAERGHYRLASLSLVAIEGAEVNGSILRDIPTLRIMRWLLPRTFVIDAGRSSEAVRRYAQSSEQGEPLAKPDLDDVATIYRLASVVRDAPAKAVAETFGFPPRTASNWLVRAKERGYVL